MTINLIADAKYRELTVNEVGTQIKTQIFGGYIIDIITGIGNNSVQLPKLFRSSVCTLT